MDDEEFGWLVERLANESANKPRAFRTKVLLISSAAHALLFASMLVIVVAVGWALLRWMSHGLSVGVVLAGLLGLALTPLTLILLREFLTPMPTPAGRPVSRAEAPTLFKMLDKMRDKLKGPPIDWVLIDTEYNASMLQLPRWGLIGPSTNYLMLGLPFMFGQSTTEMMATVAHEYGHLCGHQGQSNAWLHRQRRTMRALGERLEIHDGASVLHTLLARALDAFMPYFNAYTFVLSRQDEYDADRAAARLAGKDVAAASLVRSDLLATWFHQEFWTTLYRQADRSERPAFMPYQSMSTAFRMNHAQWANGERLAAALQVSSEVRDTHPCLRERVAALGQQPALPEPLAKHAAGTLLGRLAEQLASEFDQSWWAAEKKDWAERHRYVKRALARLDALRGVPLSSLPLQDLQELARLKAEFQTAHDAKPVLEYLLRQPGGPFPRAAYSLGCILLDEGDSSGLDYLAMAARNNRHLTNDAMHAGYSFLMANNDPDFAQEWCDGVVRRMAA